MSRPIEQALNNLIPRQPGSLPPELIELASSLLAQSRNKAGNLKAEEEVGRTYACANIACERLKSTLNLPPIEPRPPIAPRAYNKLYAYLDRSLISNTPRKRTKTQHSTLGSNGIQKALPQRHTPTKEKSFEGFRAGNRTEKKGLKYASNREKDYRVPGWIAPVVRMLCRDMLTRTAVPHVLAGVESVLCLPPPQSESSAGESKKEGRKMRGNLPALIAAIWFFVCCKMLGKDTTGEEYVKRRRLVLETLQDVRDDEALLEKVGDAEGAWEGWEDVRDVDITAWVKELTEKGWLDLDWFLNIEEEAHGGGGDDDDESEDEGRQQWVSNRNRGELERVGLGSMRVERFNYLSTAKRKEYKRWKRIMLLKLDKMVAAGTLDDEMDTREE